jgi:plastocyanin
MRRKLIALPLSFLLAGVTASPAAAADWTANVIDYEFQPATQTIAVGDSVTWSFTDGGHTSATLDERADSWQSIDEGANAPGTSYTHVFRTAGRFQYVCLQHRDFMKGVVVVGTDTVADSVDRLRAKRTGKRVRVSFVLNEPATVRYSLKGPAKRTVKRGRLAAGSHSLTLRRLKRGRYRGVLTVVDDFDKRVAPRNSFVVR